MADTDTTPTGSDPIEEANIANMLAKLGAGKVLTTSEEQRLKEYRARQAQPSAGKSAARVADSMAAAAAMTGLTEGQISRAKEAGCPAFRGSRVHVDELIEWFEENEEQLPTGDTELDNINREIAREKLRKAKFANDVAEGKFIEVGQINEDVQRLAAETLSILRRVIEDESPRLLAGKTEEEIRALAPQLVDEICEAVHGKLSTWLHSAKRG